MSGQFIGIVTGHLGRDPETKYTPHGTAITNLSVAADDYRGGENKTLWVDVTLFGKDAERASEYLMKGSLVQVVGRVTQDEWESNGETKRKWKVNGNSFAMLGSRPKQEDATPTAKHSSQPQSQENEDDLPF